MTLWLEGYEHDPEQGAGLSVGAGHVKCVLHTTETPRGTWGVVRNLWRGANNWGKGLPHFLADGDRYVQLLPLNVGAYTLENAPGGADTNRSGPAIQVEICGKSADGFNDAEYRALGKWLADLVKAGIDLDLSQHPHFYGANEGIVLATYNAPQRMSAATYQAFGGFCGHQHVPENAHWDPGALDADRVELIARTNLGLAPIELPKEWDEMATQEEVRAIVREEVNGLRPQIWADADDGRCYQVFGFECSYVPGPAVLSWLINGRGCTFAPAVPHAQVMTLRNVDTAAATITLSLQQQSDLVEAIAQGTVEAFAQKLA